MHKYIDMERLESWERLNSKILFPLWWNYAATKNKKYSERPAALYCKLLNSMQKRSTLYCDTCKTLRSWQMFCIGCSKFKWKHDKHDTCETLRSWQMFCIGCSKFKWKHDKCSGAHLDLKSHINLLLLSSPLISILVCYEQKTLIG